MSPSPKVPPAVTQSPKDAAIAVWLPLHLRLLGSLGLGCPSVKADSTNPLYTWENLFMQQHVLISLALLYVKSIVASRKDYAFT